MEDIIVAYSPLQQKLQPGFVIRNRYPRINEMIQKESAFIDILKMEMDKVIVGPEIHGRAPHDRLTSQMATSFRRCARPCKNVSH